jgi:hypothetical protein
MSKLHCLRFLTALVVFTFSAGLQSQAVDKPFRIGMRLGYGPHTPFRPAPPRGGTHWEDVTAWQLFMSHEGHPPARGYRNNVFDKATEQATKSYQHRKHLPATGVVNWATYHAAFGAGRHPNAILPPRTASMIRGNCHIRFPMGVGCRDLGLYRDVSDWQLFLVDMGYIGAPYPTGVFDNTTRSATARFETDSAVSPSGIVEMHAIHAAERTGHFSCRPMHIPCPQGIELSLRATGRSPR